MLLPLRQPRRACRRLVLPDDVVAHPLQVSLDIASLAPKELADLKARTISRAHTFLKRYQTA